MTSKARFTGKGDGSDVREIFTAAGVGHLTELVDGVDGQGDHPCHEQENKIARDGELKGAQHLR